MIRCAEHLVAAVQVLAVRFADLRYFFPQLCDALLDGPGHGDRLAEHVDVASAVITKRKWLCCIVSPLCNVPKVRFLIGCLDDGLGFNAIGNFC